MSGLGQQLLHPGDEDEFEAEEPTKVECTVDATVKQMLPWTVTVLAAAAAALLLSSPSSTRRAARGGGCPRRGRT